jgi:preprotein translocase subunit SecE
MKNNMIKETKSELKKVIWPSRKDVINGTIVVAVLVVIVGAIILAFDFESSALVKKIISRDDFVITDIDHTGHDHEEENIEPPVEGDAQLPVEENSEPTIDNNEVTE